jgi:HlyD family secretion protein
VKRGLVIAVGVAALGGGGYWAWSASGDEVPAEAQTRVATVRRGKLTHALQASGEVRPKRLIELKSKASGQITMFAKIEGEPVDPKEVLVELDPVVEQRNFERATANLESAKARMDQIRNDAVSTRFRTQSDLKPAKEDVDVKKADYDRLKQIGDVAASRLEQAHYAVTVAEERLRQLESALAYLDVKQKTDEALAKADVALGEIALKEAEDRLADTRVKPPITGILLKKMVEEGQIVSSGISSVSGGTTLGMIADVSELIIIANVVESDVGKVSVGQEARVSVDAFEGRTFAGRVIHIPPQTEIEQGIAHFKVKVAVPGAEAREFLRVGMTADIQMIIEERPDALYVPSEAVVRKDGKAYLRRPDGSQTEVQVGLDTGLDAQIVSGIAEKEEILVPLMMADSPRWSRSR